MQALLEAPFALRKRQLPGLLSPSFKDMTEMLQGQPGESIGFVTSWVGSSMERIIPAKTVVSAMAMAGNVPAYVMHRRGPLWLEW